MPRPSSGHRRPTSQSLKMGKLLLVLATVLLCSAFVTAQVKPNEEIGRVTVQVPLLSNGKPVMSQDNELVEVARVVEVKPGKLTAEEVVVPLVKVRNMRAIRDTENPGVPNPGIPNPGMPNPGIPNRGMPNPGIENPGMPNPGIPNPGMPNPGIPNRGMPNPGIENPGMPNPGIPNPGMPNPGIPNRSMPNPGIENPGMPNPGIPNPGVPNPGIPNPGMPNPGIPNPGMPNPGIPNRGMPNPGIPNPGMPNPGIPNPGMPNPGIPVQTASSEVQPTVVAPANTTTEPGPIMIKGAKSCHQLLLASSAPAKPLPVQESCDQLCTKFELMPICAYNGVCIHEFPNQCVMDTFNCKHRDLAFRAVDEDICMMDLCARRCKEQDLKI
ncbi:vegetative cell wall protein gp1 [Drosophila mojavensis]|uniref:vegetative cell wall protein gp1 n=1 Tax=Drosophila mojavensis TaxID=7230 RepID=UPI0013EEA468|nr:vegetative cell wall protein gp1 [Drosophila mojavensis]